MDPGFSLFSPLHLIGLGSLHTPKPMRGVSLGDDHRCKVAGIRTIKVRMFVGMVQLLINVKHGPVLKNLVSLGYLEWNGYNFSSHSRSGVLNITKGAMVMVRGRLENNLYRMEGSVVSEGSKAAAAQEQQDAYYLWHFRLDHMKDCSTRVMSKSGMIPGLDGGVSEVCEPCQISKQYGKVCH